jgi:general secretion pathway protein M
MMKWWVDLSSRERLLIGAAGVLAAILVVSLLVIRPLADWRSDAASRAARAQDSFELVAAAASTAGARTVQAANAETPLRQAVTGSAASSDIDLVRIGAEVNGQIEVQPQTIDGDKLFQWLGVLEREYGVSIAFADIARAEQGGVNAQVLVFERK